MEDPTNAHPVYWRNVIRQVLASHAKLYPGLQQLTDICKDARRITDRAGKALNCILPNVLHLSNLMHIIKIDHFAYKTLHGCHGDREQIHF